MNHRLTTALVVSLVVSAGAWAQAEKAGAGEATSPVAQASEAMLTEGTIRKVNKAAGKVTIQHGALARLEMPAMTMVFRVKDATWLERMKEGDRIRFDADKIDGLITVIRFEPMP